MGHPAEMAPSTYQLHERTGELRGGGVLPVTSLDLFLSAWGDGYLSPTARARVLDDLSFVDTIPLIASGSNPDRSMPRSSAFLGSPLKRPVLESLRGKEL